MRGPWLVSIALVAACGAKLGGDPAVTGGGDAPSGSVDAPQAAVIDAPLAPPIDAPPPDARACTGGSDVEGHCYLYHADQLAWAAAGSACAADGTHLAIVMDAVQDAAVLSLLGSANPAFLGATDEVTEGSFLWVDGTQITANEVPLGSAYTNFNAGEPNNGGAPSTHEEDCLVMRVDGTAAGKWDDRPCAPEGVSTPGVYPYVCEL